MNGKRKNTVGTWNDPDDAPELDDGFFEEADEYQGRNLVRRGRPRADKTKQRITMRVDEDVLAAFKAGGPGWQTRMNQALKTFLEEHPGEV